METRKGFLNSLILASALTVASMVAVNATTTIYYFSSSTGSNANQALYSCSEAHPCHDFAGTTLDNASALSPGDKVLFKRGDEWVASPLYSDSAGTDADHVTFGAYGTGANPIFAGAAVTTAGWTGAGPIYQLAGQSQTQLNTVTQNDNKGLIRWTGAVGSVPEGYFIRSGTTLYAHFWGGVNPATNNVRVGSYSQSFDMGLVRTSLTTARAAYNDFKDLTIVCANGRAFSRHGTGGQDAGLVIVGAGFDGYLGWYRSTNGQAQQFVSYYADVSYTAAMGTTYGQGVTVYGSPYTFFVGLHSHHNGMAGIDLLDFSSDTNVTQSGLIRCRANNNSLISFNPAYDPDVYFDGASETFSYGLIVGPSLGGYLGNLRDGIRYGSEKPTSKPAENHWLINTLGYGIKGKPFHTGNICYNSSSECPPSGDSTVATTIKNLSLAYNTFLSRDASSDTQFEFVYGLTHVNTTANNIKLYNNIFVQDSSYTDSFASAGSELDADYNQYYDRGTASSSTNIYHTCVSCSGTAYNLASWRTASGEDANSAYGDPLFVTDGDSSPDVHLGVGSPARDSGSTSAYTYPDWLPQEIKDDIGPYGIRGTTKADGTFDDVATSPDRGFHYDYARLFNVTVTPTTYTAGAVTSYTVSFQMKKYSTALLYNWKIKFTLPAGCTLSSGAASTVTSSDISGTFSSVVSGQSITATRVGDGESEFPGTYTFVISNVKNPDNAGTTGSFYLETQDSSGTKIAEPYTDATATNAITGISITSGAGAVCGNSIIESGESCDDGGTTGGDGCSAACQTETPVCGNSIVEYLEQCDDGNTTALDGCSDTCQIESPVCGNGVTEEGEQCDDNNTDNGDGCDSSCQDESSVPGPHFSCSGPRTLAGKATIT